MNYSNFKRQFGQNFIKDLESVRKMISALNIEKDDLIIEIGPGDGRVTQQLLESAPGKLISIEVDIDLIPILQTKFKDYLNFELINQSILTIDFDELTDGKPYKVIGSLPYNISKPIIKILTETKNKPQIMSFIVQKEVAQDYSATPPEGCFLSNFVSIFYDVKYKGTVDKNDFVPRPKVDGGIICFTKKEQAEVSEKDYVPFSKFLFNCFRQPRKKMTNTLKGIYKEVDWPAATEKAGISSNARAAEVEFKEFKELFKFLLHLN